MKRLFCLCLMLISMALISLSTTAFAKGTASEKNNVEFTVLSVSDILNHPVNEQKIIVHGEITRVKGNDKYIVSDGKSEMSVSLAGKIHKYTAFTVGQNVVITGEVKVGVFNPTPDIKAYTIEAQ